MNTRFVEAFLWIARLGSFRAAAERLHVTQAAISNRIASLEEEIGARVFERDPRDLRLTPVGLRLLDYGERMLELQREMIALGHPHEELLGLVRIGAIESVVHTWLVDFLGTLQRLHPGIEVQLTSETTLALHERLQIGAIDIALQTDPMASAEIVNMACPPMAMGWVGAGASAPQPDEGRIAHLLLQPVLTMSPGSQPHQALKQLYRQASMPVGKVHCVSSMAAIVRLVQSGFGNALIPLPPVREEIERGDLRVIACDTPLPPQRIVVSHLDASGSAAIRRAAELACSESERFAASLSAPFRTPGTEGEP
ncbi:LysR family transcriptional regulator [Acidovorax sp. NCPPB 3576]|uniref:LysR family transcriptional regulator n=1 Tax=Acidovorax sp. NCPPB 3576 TaxID=2940488 RepID=UPI002348FB7E|nr:LysR family transcriptional regulator [Acidovorax sp. NCPPB 3576]WCM87595.1 LysR family transcriptional regulator [Acidovorax sp. NCPPB 3576]